MQFSHQASPVLLDGLAADAEHFGDFTVRPAGYKEIKDLMFTRRQSRRVRLILEDAEEAFIDKVAAAQNVRDLFKQSLARAGFGEQSVDAALHKA